MRRYDVAIVGGGIVGLALAREILRRRPGRSLVVLEKETGIARHQTGHNSGVIHSGVYYAPGSLKAELCVAGSRAMTRFCTERGIPWQACGKVIVATEESELPRLAELLRRGEVNGVPGVEMIGPERLRDIEPAVVGIRAVHCPRTGIVDYGLVAGAMAADVRSGGGEIRTGFEVRAIAEHGDAVTLSGNRDELSAGVLVACAGLQADRVAALAGGSPEPRIVPFRGDYYELRPERRDLVRALVYPVPDPALPFLGVHFTRRPDGAVWCGPNAVLAFAREGYRFADVDPDELAATLAFPGFRALARRWWRVGAAELHRDLSAAVYLRSLRRYIPELRRGDLLPGPSGVRAQAVDGAGRLLDDFAIDLGPRSVHVRNAPSPAATSSLAIAAHVADSAERAGVL